MSSANRDNYTSSFLIRVTFISFSCLIALPRTFSAMNTSHMLEGEGMLMEPIDPRESVLQESVDAFSVKASTSGIF